MLLLGQLSALPDWLWLGNLSHPWEADLWEHGEAEAGVQGLCVLPNRVLELMELVWGVQLGVFLPVDAAGKHSYPCSMSDDVISEPALLSRLQGGEAPCSEEEPAPGEIPAEPGAGKG